MSGAGTSPETFDGSSHSLLCDETVDPSGIASLPKPVPPRKRKYTAGTSKKELGRKLRRKETGGGKTAHADKQSQIPLGNVDGDRIFCRDSDGEWYADIEQGKYSEWKKIEDGNVFWGMGNSAVWVYNTGSSVSEYAWQVLKMDPERLQALHQRNRVQVKKCRKPVLLHGVVGELIEEREEEITVYKAAIQSAEEMKEQAEKLREVKFAEEKFSADAEKEISLLSTRMAKMSQEEQRRREESRCEIAELRRESESAADKVDSDRTDLAESERRRVIADSKATQAIAEAHAGLRARGEDVQKAMKEIDALKKKLVKATEVSALREIMAKQFASRRGLDPHDNDVIDLSMDDDLSTALDVMKAKLVSMEEWAGDEWSGRATNWLKPPFDLLLEMRSRRTKFTARFLE